MINKIIRLNLFIFVFLNVFTSFAEYFDPAQIYPATEKFFKDIAKEIESEDLKIDCDFKILPSDSLLLRPEANSYRFEPIYTFPGVIYINERIFNKLSLEERRFLAGKAILLQKTHYSKLFYTILTRLPGIFVSIGVGLTFGALSIEAMEYYSDFHDKQGRLMLGTLAGFGFSIYFIKELFDKLNKRKLKAEVESAIRLNAFDGAISYYSGILNIIKEKKYLEPHYSHYRFSFQRTYKNKIEYFEQLKKENLK